MLFFSNRVRYFQIFEEVVYYIKKGGESMKILDLQKMGNDVDVEDYQYSTLSIYCNNTVVA